MIRNTTEDMNDPLNAMLFLAEAMGPGGSDRAIENQEKRAQQELVNSDRLPTESKDANADFIALGFTLGDPDPADPLFRPAALPQGWKREASDHDMWSYIVDSLGRRRVSIFYKGAFYDRSAFMRLTSIYEYVHQCGYDGTDLITDDAWATPDAITTEALAAVKRCDEYIEMYSDERYAADGFGKRHVAEQQVQRARFAALVAQFGTEAGAL